MEKIKREDIKPETNIKILYQFLKENVRDEHPRDKVDDFTLGKQAGKLELLDMIKQLAGE
jgi:hypothetical protein